MTGVTGLELQRKLLSYLIPFLFLGSTGLQLVICDDMFHLCKSWEGQFFCESPTLEKLAKANLEEYFKRSHNKGFVWPLCVTVASTRNNLWVKSANKKTNYALSQILEDKLFYYLCTCPPYPAAPSVRSREYQPDMQRQDYKFDDGLSNDQPPLTSPQNQRASSWQWSAGSWDVSLWDLGSRCSRESWKIRNIFSKQRNNFCKNLI